MLHTKAICIILKKLQHRILHQNISASSVKISFIIDCVPILKRAKLGFPSRIRMRSALGRDNEDTGLADDTRHASPAYH